mmetsp:Transcript_33576/g.51649  ORF Transcript_33576/g.51649 Transcript_33576/m.51649 type:complete len:80 (-) Transcript_33576:965-1204(-)
MLLERYTEQDDANLLELMINLVNEHQVWFSQAHEALYACKDPTQFQKVVPAMMMSVIDRHVRFALSAQASSEGEYAMNA